MLKRMRDDSNVDDVEGEDDFFPRLDRREAVKVRHGKDNNCPRRRLIVNEEEHGKEEEQSASTSVEPRSGRNLGSKQNKQTLSSDHLDNDQGFLTHIAATLSSSRSQSAKGKENIESESSASRISRVGEDDDDDGITTTPEVPWSLFANKDSVLALGDEDSDDVHNDDDDFSPDENYGDADSCEDEFTDETEIDGIHFDTVPVIRQAGGSNQYGEMLGSVAQFGKPYPAQRDQERFTNDPSCDFDIPGTNHDRIVSGKTINSSNGGIPSAFGISSASTSKGTSAATNNTPPNIKRVQKKLSESDGSRGRGDFISKRSGNKTSKKGNKGKKSDPDDDDDSTEDPSSSEDDDAPNIDQGFAINTRIFMADGSAKRIKKIKPGEYVLGPDRLPRLVVGADAGYSPMIQVRELSQNIAHLPDDFFGLVTFSCTPKQALRLATAQHQGVHVGHDVKNRLHRVDFRKLKRVQGALIVVGSHENFRDSLPNARQEAEAFARNRSKDVIYWTLPVDCRHLVSVAVQLQTCHLTAALDFDAGRLRYHALKSGFTDTLGIPEKVAYIWGTWIGDGCSTWARIAVNRKDKEQIARIGEVCFDLGLAAHLYELSEKEKAIGNLGGQVGITSRVHIRRNYFMIFLRRLGLGKSGAKYVPRWLRKEAISVREHFLAGLIDSDGCREQQRRPFVSDSNGATPHDRDKSSQCRIYKRAPITTVYPKIAEGVFVLARSLGIPYSISYRPAWIHGDRARQQVFRIKLQPCSALTNILSLCAVDTKWQSAPLTFARHHIEYRYGTFCQEVVAAVHKLPDLPPEKPLSPDEITALVRQLDYPTLALLAKRYHNFGHSHKQIREILGVSSTITSAYFSNKRNDKKLENFMRAQVSEKLSIEEIRRLVLLTRNPSRHHAVALSLDPATDGLFVLGNNTVVTSREQMTRRSSQLITIFCIIDGQPSSSPFCIKISNGFTVDDLKTSIKTKQFQLFKNIEAISLRLWRVLIDEASHHDKVVLLSDVSAMDKKLLMSTDRLSAVFPKPPSEGYIHIVIEISGAPECQQDQDHARNQVTTPNSLALLSAWDIETLQLDYVPPVKSSISDQVKQQPSPDLSTVPKSGTAAPEDKPPHDVNFCAHDPTLCVAAIISNETSKHDHSVNSTAAGEASHQSEKGTPDPFDAAEIRTPKLKRTFSFMEENTGDTPEQDIIPCSSRPASSTKRVCFPPQMDRHDHPVDPTAAGEASDHSEQDSPESSNSAEARRLKRIISFMDGESGSPPEQDRTSSTTKNTCFPDQDRCESSERIHLIYQAQGAIRKLNNDKRRATLDLLQISIELYGPAREQASRSMLNDLEKIAKVSRRHLRDYKDRIAKINKWLQHTEELDT
ncbi:unnamed protein product [Mortierella alpina]